MKKYFRLAVFMFSLIQASALILNASEAVRPNAFVCEAKIQGGVDIWPWSHAQPFPWNNIQGVWILRQNDSTTYLRARVIKTTNKIKQLNLAVYSENNCVKPIAKGSGYIDSSEKNVVRAFITDGKSKYQIKLAMFGPEDLKDMKVDMFGCDDNVMAASLKLIGSDSATRQCSSETYFSSSTEIENILLKKVSDDFIINCKK